MNRGGARAEGRHGVSWEVFLLFNYIYGERGRTTPQDGDKKLPNFSVDVWAGRDCHRVSGAEKKGKEQGNEPWGCERRRFVREDVSSTSPFLL